MKNYRFSKLLLLLIICIVSTAVFSQKQQSQWKTLFNGKDLSNWDTYLRAPNLIDYSDDPSIPYMEPIGLNNDPLHVFTVKDGLLRISGQIWGAITTKEVYSNYHVRFVTKWGQKKWVPKDKSLRDGGLLFHCTDGFDYGFKCWMRSMEMQLQEGEIGDFFNVGGGDAEFQMTLVKTLNNETSNQYDPSQPLKRNPGRVYRSGDFESPAGQWTTSEMVARHSDAVFIVNGFVVNRLFNIYRPDLNRQVTSGKLQFQSEGAEHFYKKIEIRSISFKHGTPLLVSKDTALIIAQGEQQKIEIINNGDAVEIIAAEILGKEIDRFIIELPAMPLIFKKGDKIILPVSLKPGTTAGNKVKFRLETVLGPVPDFETSITTK